MLIIIQQCFSSYSAGLSSVSIYNAYFSTIAIIVYNVIVMSCELEQSHRIFSILIYLCNIICRLLYHFFKEMSVLFSSNIFVQFNVENATLFVCILHY